MVNTGLMAKASLGLHAFQGVWSIVVMGVIAASMLQNGVAGGAARYMFALCWLTIPGLIYLTMTPRFPRTRMFAHPYWIIAMNSLYNILWFAAFVAVSVYTNKGISSGGSKEKDDKIKKEGGCALFPAGTGETAKACKLNKSAVGLGVFMWFLWLATTGIAGYAAWYYSKNSVSPFDDLVAPSHEIQETTKDAFSSNDEYAPINSRVARSEYEEEETEVSYDHERSHSVASSAYSSYDQAHPGRPLSWAAEREPITGIGGHAPIAPAHGDVSMPEIPDDYSYRGARR